MLQAQGLSKDERRPARVSWAARDSFRLWTADGEIRAGIEGKLRREGIESRPVVGDWVTCRGGLIESVLPRRTRVVRKMAGAALAPQRRPC